MSEGVSVKNLSPPFVYAFALKSQNVFVLNKLLNWKAVISK